MDGSRGSKYSMMAPRLGSRISTTVVAALLLALVGLRVSTTAFAKDEGGLGPGCASDRPAIAHRANGIRVVLGQRANAPIPCSTNTGYRTSEIGMVVTNSGSIVGFQPGLQTPWVGFGQACPLGLPVAGNPNCPATLTGAPTDALWGIVGRLVRIGGEAYEDSDH